MTNLLLHKKLALVSVFLVGLMDFVPFSLIEGLQSLLQVDQVLLVLLLQFLQCILQGKLQLFLLLLQKLWRLNGANCKMKITGWNFGLGKTSWCRVINYETNQRKSVVEDPKQAAELKTTWTSTAKRDRHKRQTRLIAAIVSFVIEERHKSSCRLIIESGNITGVMIKAVKLVFSWQFAYGGRTQNLLIYCAAVVQSNANVVRASDDELFLASPAQAKMRITRWICIFTASNYRLYLKMDTASFTTTPIWRLTGCDQWNDAVLYRTLITTSVFKAAGSSKTPKWWFTAQNREGWQERGPACVSQQGPAILGNAESTHSCCLFFKDGTKIITSWWSRRVWLHQCWCWCVRSLQM